MSENGRIGIVGGTGGLGGGLAMALAKAGFDVLIGSRDPSRAVSTADAIGQATGTTLTGLNNLACAQQADVVIVTVPSDSQMKTLASIKPFVSGKIVLDTTVPLKPPKVARVQLPVEGSAAMRAFKVLGAEARLVTGFHSVSALKLRKGERIDGDVLFFSDDVPAREMIIEIARRIGLRGIHAGPLANAIAGEALTSVLIGINKRYGIAEGAGISITGLPASVA